MFFLGFFTGGLTAIIIMILCSLTVIKKYDCCDYNDFDDYNDEGVE